MKFTNMKKRSTFYVTEDSDRGLTKTWNSLSSKDAYWPGSPWSALKTLRVRGK